MHSVMDIAMLLNVSRDSVQRWIRTGKLIGEYRNKIVGVHGQRMLVIEDSELRRFLDLNPKYKLRMLGRDFKALNPDEQITIKRFLIDYNKVLISIQARKRYADVKRDLERMIKEIDAIIEDD